MPISRSQPPKICIIITGYNMKVRSSSNMRHIIKRPRPIAPIHSLLAGLSPCKYWSLQGEEAIYSTPSAKVRRFIWVEVMKGGRKKGNVVRNQLHSTRQWYLEESVTKMSKTRAASLSRAPPAATPGDVWWYRFSSTAVLTELCWAFSNRFIVLSLVHHQVEKL